MLPITFYNIGLNYKFYGTTPIINNIGSARSGSVIIFKSDIYYYLVALQTLLQAIAFKVMLNKQFTIYLFPIFGTWFTSYK